MRLHGLNMDVNHSSAADSSTGTTERKGVKQRAEIDPRYKWRLEDIYANDEMWREDLIRLKEMIPQIGGFQGRLSESGGILFRCLDLRDRTAILFHKLHIYAYLKLDEDNRQSQYQAMSDEISALSVVLAEAGSYLTPEILAISDERLESMRKEYPELSLYDHHLETMRRMREHILSPEEEKLMALSGNVTRSPSQIFRMIDDADVKFGTVTDEKGEVVELTKQRYYELLESKDRRVRKEATDVLNQGYRSHLNTLGATLSGSVYKDLFYTRARKYSTCLEGSLDADNIPQETYRNLIETVDRNLEVLHRYVALRKRVLGYDELFPYDLFVPLVPEAKMEIGYDQAVKMILEALKPLGEEYLKNVKMAFEAGWIDVYETEGKGSGAYSWSTYATHPYVLMNYNNTLDNMFTLSHEMGHAMHSYFSKLHQPFVYSGHSIFTAEVASTTNEELLMHHLLEQTQDKAKKAYLLSYYLHQIVGVFFTQVMYSQFEDQIHRDVEEGKPLSAEIFRQTYRGIYQRFWGDQMVMKEDTDMGCLRVPHFYRSFYVYQYATSYAASTLISQRILEGDRAQVEKYLGFLQAGESKYAIDVLKDAGVDLTKPEVIEAVPHLFGRLLDQLEETLFSP